MKLFFSPSKGMHYKTFKYSEDNDITNIPFKEKTDFLVSVLKNFSEDEVSTKLKIKGKILDDVLNIYSNFYNQVEREAIALYDGVSYKQLCIENFSRESYNYMRDNVFIFSALYGVLNACTPIKPYRLDMTNKILEISPYDFWREDIENYLLQFKNETFINIASNEFSKILNRKVFNVVDIEFRQYEGDKIKNISTEAKKARGALLNYLIENKIDCVEDIRNFNSLGYIFSSELSSEKAIFFIKK
ncbi:MAG: YaaA family protein [Cetobacterium sp.]|uniref:YaaA family protein n=1 Tax=Cetobacterium sp. TaxID=2071632 RepID=UPI003F353D90